YGAAAVLMVERRWWRLFQAAALTFGVEVLILASDTPRPDVIAWDNALAVASFVAVGTVAAVLYALQARRPRVPVEVAVQLTAAPGTTFAGALLLFPGATAAGLALIASGLAFALPGFLLLRRDRDLACVLGAGGLLLAGIGLGAALDGGWRVAAF